MATVELRTGHKDLRAGRTFGKEGQKRLSLSLQAFFAPLPSQATPFSDPQGCHQAGHPLRIDLLATERIQADGIETAWSAGPSALDRHMALAIGSCLVVVKIGK